MLSKIKLFLIILFTIGFLTGQSTFAEGDGTGGGKNEPLTLVASTIQNGATGVTLKPDIKLTFSKNIVNMTVSENNKKCFSLQNENGAAIPIDVIFTDDQMDYEGRNDALIKPKVNLDQGTTYSLVINANLTSKSGVTTGKEIRISFTTEGSKQSPTSPNPATPAPENTQAPVTTIPKSEITNSNEPTNKANTSTTTPATTTKTAEVPNHSDQQTADTKTETVDTNTNDTQPIQSESKDTTTNVSEENAKKPVPYTAAKNTSVKTENKQTNNANSIMIIVGLLVIVLISVGIFYIRRRKKQAH